MLFRLNVPTARDPVLNGVLFRREEKRTADTVMIAITGIHGNFYSNPFYYNIGDTLNSDNIDFIYAQTNDAFGEIETVNVKTGKKEVIGSWNERFSYTDEDIEAYLSWVYEQGYEHVILAGHSLGANKVIYYLSRHHDPRIEHFFLLSPANLTYMMSGVTNREKMMIKNQVARGDGNKMLPFPFMGWVECIANTAYDWQFSGLLNNVHTAKDGDFSQAAQITHNGALLVAGISLHFGLSNCTYFKPPGISAHFGLSDCTYLIPQEPSVLIPFSYFPVCGVHSCERRRISKVRIAPAGERATPDMVIIDDIE